MIPAPLEACTIMEQKDRPFYRKKYRNELIEELTGYPIRRVRNQLRRKGWDIGQYLSWFYERNRNRAVKAGERGKV